ncbi:MAG: 2-C-methyl-D-erythritol 2,4-cyclodiphosphate synthase [Candidatus Omnitrophica bacterium]|nr:2-C-methyl-D-erythritol 2,4-cyclodiphosphate synthase [Candidatus Omnitrophota bacterium]
MGKDGFRTGIGSDIHALKAGRKLILGGVCIPHTKGLLGHSDADVLIHAVIDALLGALGAGDIGEHFPDTSARFKDANSGELLKTVVREVRRRGFGVVNCDTTVCAERPRLGPHKERIRKSLAGYLGIAVTRVNVKAKTAEGFDAVGQGKAVTAQCVVLLEKK